MHFTKMHGLGNDYLYVYGEAPENASDLSIKLSQRHFGPGSNGMIYISKSDKADFKMRIFNADGSEAKMCGNGIRCVGKYVYDKGYTDKTHLQIETLSGIKYVDLQLSCGRVRSVTVNMGTVVIEKDKTITVNDNTVTCTPVSVGNPHIVIFVDDIEKAPLLELGPLLERHKDFLDGVNVEFVQIISEKELRMRVWERGSGVTKACGTGACAAVAAAVSKNICDREMPISVYLDGGTLKIQVNFNNTVTMTGPANTVYEGETDLC